MKKLGFGAMRLPMNCDKVDIEHFIKMVDTFMDNGFNYFDTAKVYIDGQSETALKEALTSRYPRECFILTDKLSKWCFSSEEEILPMFEAQLEACGVEYFDYYLMHAQNTPTYEDYKRMHCYEIAQNLKAEGKIKHIGISFHDTAEVLDRILTEQPCVEVVQLQFNYLDYESDSVQSRKCYEVARKHGKDVLVMEPVKGGGLANIPDEAKEVFSALGTMSPASYAIRFAAGFDGIMTVLSGMSNLDQLNDNISYMKDFVPLDEKETEAVFRVAEIINSKYLIPCTACKYCVDGCPMEIKIPSLFRCLNNLKAFGNQGAFKRYEKITEDSGKASACIECGACEGSCPQNLNIRELLKEVAETFEK